MEPIRYISQAEAMVDYQALTNIFKICSSWRTIPLFLDEALAASPVDTVGAGRPNMLGGVLPSAP